MKKALSIVLCLAVLLTSFMQPLGLSAEETPTIKCEDVTCNPGDAITVDVAISNNPGFCLLAMTPEYSKELEFDKVINGTLISDLTEGKNYLWVSDNDMTRNGTLMTFSFKVSENAEPGEYSVNFIVRQCANYSEQLVEFSVIPGIITVKASAGDCAHSNTTTHEAVESNCSVQGHGEYVTCDDCGRIVSGSDELLPLSDHKLTHHSAKSPTESSDGNVEYWKCDTCGKCFSDSEAKTEIEESGTVVSKDLPRLEIEGATTRAGKTVEIYVSINNNPGIISLRNKIVYDTEALELESVEDTGLLKSFTTPAPTITSPYTLRWADSLALANNNANGKIIKLVFKVKDETVAGKYEISVNFVESYTFLGEKVQFLSATSFVEVVDYIVGDADGDGEVSDWDAILLQRYLAGWNVDIELVALDFDGDGEVSDWDAILFERYLAGWNIEIG